MLVTAPGTELAILLCFGCLESPPPSGGSACPVYKGWVGKSELFNFKCYNKSKCSRDQGNEHLEHKLEVLCQDCWSSHPASGLLGNGMKDAVWLSSGHFLLGWIPLDCLCRKSGSWHWPASFQYVTAFCGVIRSDCTWGFPAFLLFKNRDLGWEIFKSMCLGERYSWLSSKLKSGRMYSLVSREDAGSCVYSSWACLWV